MGVKKAKPYPKKNEFSGESAFERVKAWAAENTRAVAAIVTLVVLAAVIGSAIAFRMHSNQLRAQAEYAAIASTLPGEGGDNAAGWNKAIVELRKFISRNANTAPALDARTELAKGYFETKDYAGAVKAFQEALGAAPRESSLRFAILYQLGYACEAAGKTDEALKAWSELKKLGVPALDREVYWNLGRIYQDKKQWDKADQMLALASRAPGEYPSGPRLTSRLAVLKGMKK